MPDRDVLQRWRDIAANETREPGQILRQYWIALMRHRGRVFVPFAEIFLRRQHLGPLQMPDLGREPLDLARHHAKRGKIISVAVTRNDLGGDRLRPKS